ncbi:TonB-dependent receptor [uncultured Polaribacter sp.]|uniref:SusC/RagA family TonB-linked outer membrane protein n=1 Tax=uncultured Polaribacter sp. TaxID=174711 RepID=UPI002632C13F|nr:TonB-dependent receptor [uncultured Polaribacter sp.]
MTIKTDQLLTVDEVFDLIIDQTAFRFMYPEDLFKELPKVTVKKGTFRLGKLLQQILPKGQFSIVLSTNNRIVINKKTKAQQRQVSGKVTDATGQPIPGVTVMLKGTSRGTATDFDGNYQISVPDPASVLVFSYLGYATQEILVGTQRIMNISLKESVNALDEVTINAGYYKTSQRQATGNIAKVTAVEIEQQPVSNPLQTLQGRMSGVYIQQQSGVPGGAFSILIRGQNSLRDGRGGTINGNLPLYLIDGVPFPSASISGTGGTNLGNAVTQGGNPLSTINPNDIESIEVLKDADATSIYGSRGANGVVLITTKRGKTGKTKIDVNYSYGLGQVTNKMNLLNTEEYLEMRNEAFANDNFNPPSFFERFFPDVFFWDQDRFTDWQEVLLGDTAEQTNAQINISGGNDQTQFVFGGSYFRETTVFPGNNDFQRISGRFNLNHQSKNGKLNANLSVNYSNSSSNLISDFTALAFRLAPNSPSLYDEEGNLNWEDGTWFNPLAQLENKYQNLTDNLVSNAVLGYFITPEIQFKTSIGFTLQKTDENSILPLSARNPETITSTSTGSANFSTSNLRSWIVEPQLEYKKAFENGKLNTLIGTTFQNSVQEVDGIAGSGYTSDALLRNRNAAVILSSLGSNYSQYRYSALFGRINYNYDRRYIINLTGRRDGSSRFGPGKQFANFGSIGAAWLFSNEAFIKNTWDFLSYGKLRGSYGTTGNDNIGNYGYLNTYISTNNPYNGVSGLSLTRLSNPDFSWETVRKLEVGLELGFAKDKILLNTSWYRNRTLDQLLALPLPVITGQSSIQFNLPAEIENRGWEFELNTVNVNKADFKWNTSINLSIPRSKLVKYDELENSPFADRYEVGSSLFIRKGPVYTGVDPDTGIYTFEDVNEDGTIDNNDYQIIGEVAQDFFWGVQNNLTYNGLELSFLFQFVKQTGNSYITSFGDPGSFSNQPEVVLSRWQNPDDITNIQRYYITSSVAQRAALNNRISNASIVDASFIRLSNLSLAYKFPNRITNRLKLQQLKVYLQGQNLFTITNYNGLNPESQSTIALPPLQMITTGIQFTF